MSDPDFPGPIIPSAVRDDRTGGESGAEQGEAAHPPRWQTLLRSAPARIVGGFILIVLVGNLSGLAIRSVLGLQRVPAPLARVFGSIVAAGVALWAYRLFVRWTEGRCQPSELSSPGALVEWAGGALLGAGMFSVVTLGLWLAGAYHVGAGGYVPGDEIGIALIASLAVAVTEEILFRGLLFRLSERSLGTGWALLISGAFFGLVHLLSPHANWWAGIAIALEAGVFLAAAYMTTRRLWLPIGAHFGWNFVQGGVFGGAVSGRHAGGWLHGILTGPVWLSGGEFGAEASVIAVAVCLAVAALLLWRAPRQTNAVTSSTSSGRVLTSTPHA